MQKTTIASAVLAGLAIADRLQALNVEDAALHKHVCDLAVSLAQVMSLTELVDAATGIMQEQLSIGDTLNVEKGLALVKEATADLVSDQHLIDEAMCITLEQKMMLDLLAALAPEQFANKLPA